jgi:hypothetical protein
LLAVIGSKTYLVYILSRHIVLKTLFIKLYEELNFEGNYRNSIKALEGVKSGSNLVTLEPAVPNLSSTTPGEAIPDLLKSLVPPI